MVRLQQRGSTSASDAYLTQITDDLLVEKRARKAERVQYETAIRRLEEKIMGLDDSALRADTETEKGMHLRQRLEQMQEQYDFRKAEVLRLQSELRAVHHAREKDTQTAHLHEQEANLAIEKLSADLASQQETMERALRNNVANTVLEDTNAALQMEDFLQDTFGLVVCDVPSLEVDETAKSFYDAQHSENTTDTVDFPGTFTGCVGVVATEGHSVLDNVLLPGDTLLRVDDIEIASAQHLQVLLACLCRPDALLQYRRGRTVQSTRVRPVSNAAPLTCLLPDVVKLCRLTGGLTGLLSDYKNHMFDLRAQADREGLETDVLREQNENLRQECVDLRRLAESSSAKEERGETETVLDVQLVGTNAKLSQEKKILTLRLSRAQEDKGRAEEENLSLKRSLEAATERGNALSESFLKLEENYVALGREHDDAKTAREYDLERLRVEIHEAHREESEVKARSAEEQQRFLSHRVAELQAALDVERHRTTTLTQTTEQWTRRSDADFEKFVPKSDDALNDLNDLNDVPNDNVKIHDVLTQLRLMLSSNVIQKFPGFGPMEDVMNALEACTVRIPRLEGIVQVLLEKMKAQRMLSPQRAAELGYQKRRVAELEVECSSLRSAADELMKRLEESHKSSEALKVAEQELTQAVCAMSDLQQRNSYLESELSRESARVCAPPPPIQIQMPQQCAPVACVVPTAQSEVQSPGRPVDVCSDAILPQPVVNVPIPYVCTPQESFQEVEVIEHHTKVFVDEVCWGGFFFKG